MTPNAQHKRAERERRKAAGEVRVEFWMTPEMVSDLNALMHAHWTGKVTPKDETLAYALRIALNES